VTHHTKRKDNIGAGVDISVNNAQSVTALHHFMAVLTRSFAAAPQLECIGLNHIRDSLFLCPSLKRNMIACLQDGEKYPEQRNPYQAATSYFP